MDPAAAALSGHDHARRPARGPEALYGRRRAHGGLSVSVVTQSDIRPGLFRALLDDLGELGVSGPRARASLTATLSVVLSVTVALWLHLDNAWWAGISGFMVSQATSAASFKKGLQRISGTALGAAAAFLAMRWIAYDHVASYLFLFFFTLVGVLGYEVKRNGYAWLLAAVTAGMIVLMSLEQPMVTLHAAVYRTAEVAIGTFVAMLVAFALADDAQNEIAEPEPPGFLGADRAALLHATRSALSVMLIPIVWDWLELPMSGAQMGITAIVVSAVPALGTPPSILLSTVVTRGLHRIVGCLIGGAAALFCLMIPLTSFLPWLLALAGGVWIAMHIQTSARGTGYVGTQISIAFIMTLVQGFGPPLSIWPGAERFAGILIGLVILLLVSLVLWPSEEKA
ncbi:MAG: hypothetical protein CTY15_10160 [Methylocystis sp.]|nr:MAG: hypothetical protein CTY15_10160 [Methylocystis sp.]